MNRKEFNNFISFLQKNWTVYGPSYDNARNISIELIENPSALILNGELPFFSFKKFFIPQEEDLFEYKNNNLNETKTESDKKAIVGINILDLKSILLYDQVFERDPYYQVRRQDTLVIGHNFAPDIKNNIFEQKYEEEILEHLSFDIFLAEIKQNIFKVFSGSKRGQEVLNDFDYKNYQHIQFSGPQREEGNPRMNEIKEKMKNFNPSIWEKLGEICLECGKCTIICPTCFCYRIDDCPTLEKDKGVKQRCWDSCFYQEFSEVAGGYKFLNTTAKKIHFWYYHKFVRIPEEFNILGCVGCGRCAEVCPARIDIRKILKEI